MSVRFAIPNSLIRIITLAIGCALLAALPARAQDDTITLVTHDSFNASETVLAQFQDETGLTLEILRLGDAGTALNQSILSRDNPLGDVLFGVDNTFLGRALEADIFIPYESPLLEDVPDEFKLDAEFRVTPIDYGDIALNYDARYFADNELALPTTLADLTQPEYRGLLVVENPAISSPGLAFLLLTIEQFGTEGEYTYLDFWRDLVANDVFISDDWSDAYYNQFSGSAGSLGTRPLVVSYASSPPAEVFFADPQPEIAPTGTIVEDGMAFRQIEFAGILRGTGNEAGAQALIDFMLSVAFQEDMPLQMFVFPVNPAAELPEVFAIFASIPANPVTMDIETINDNREAWLQEWVETIIR
jgi:thiamine transport system substrate-binding protein